MSSTPEQNHSDDEYKKATKEVVDDMFRDDVLGPRFCSVLTNHTPASDKIKSLVAEAIANHPGTKTSIEGVIADLDSKRKGRWMDRAIGVIGTIVIGLIIWVAQQAIKESMSKKILPSTPVVQNK